MRELTEYSKRVLAPFDSWPVGTKIEMKKCEGCDTEIREMFRWCTMKCRDVSLGLAPVTPTPNPEQKPAEVSSEDESKKFSQLVSSINIKCQDIISSSEYVWVNPNSKAQLSAVLLAHIVKDQIHKRFLNLMYESENKKRRLAVVEKMDHVELLQTQLKKAEAQRDKALAGLEVYADEQNWDAHIKSSNPNIKDIFNKTINGYWYAKKTIAEVKGMKDD